MPDNYASILGDVVAIYATRPRPLGLKASHFRITHLAHGWYMRAHRTAEAIVLLRELGYAHEAWPLRRALLEHAVNLKWLAADGERVADLVRRAGAHSAKKRRASVIEAGWSSADLAIFDEVIADLDATDEHRQLDYLQAFARRVKAYGTPADYAGYLIDTAHSHPSWETAAPYIRDDGEGAVALLNDPPESSDPNDAGQCAIHLWQGLVAINSMMETPVWSAQLNQLGARIQAVQTEESGGGSARG